jgi:hypothetical protein
MSIDKDTARKVAHLARIAVKEEDLPKLAGELSAVLAFMEQLNEVDVDGIEPMTSGHADAAEASSGCGDGRQYSGADPEERAGRAGRFLCSAEGGGMSDLNKLTIAEARDALKKGETTSVALTEACLAAIDAAGALNAFVHKTPELAMERAKAADARRAVAIRHASGHSGRHQGPVLHQGRALAGGKPDIGGLQARV